MTDLERARAAFSGDRFASELVGCVIDEVGPGYARCSLRLGAQHLNLLGRPMGGVIYTLADFAYAVASNFGRDTFVTTSSEIHFLAPATGDTLVAEARQIRFGRRTCLFEISVTDGAGTNIAYATESGMLVQNEKGSTVP